jgi:hypothetical protein
MKKLILMLATCVFSSQLFASSCDPCDGWPSAGASCTRNWPSAFNLEVGGGYRQDRFQWSLAGFDNFPNVLSQLSWKDLRIAQFGATGSYVSCTNYAIRFDVQYGNIYHGKVYDADYAGNDKTDLAILSENNAGKGHVYDLSIAGGYRVTSTCSRFTATILAGYSQYAQYLHIYDGHQLVPVDVRFDGLNSTYDTRWYGPWAGVDFEARVERCAFLTGGFEWHMLAYRGHGNWNLRDDIGRFDHKAYGMGYIARLGAKWEIWNHWSLGVTGSYRNFRTRHGHENLIVFDEGGRFRMRSRFNQAKWHGYSVSAIIAWRW